MRKARLGSEKLDFRSRHRRFGGVRDLMRRPTYFGIGPTFRALFHRLAEDWRSYFRECGGEPLGGAKLCAQVNLWDVVPNGWTKNGLMCA
jgi:hypothetical protein